MTSFRLSRSTVTDARSISVCPVLSMNLERLDLQTLFLVHSVVEYQCHGVKVEVKVTRA